MRHSPLAKYAFTASNPSTSASISAGVGVEVERRPGRRGHAEPGVHRPGAVVPTRTAMPRESSTWPTSCGWMPPSSKQIAPPRSTFSVGPKMRRPSTLLQRVQRVAGERLLVRGDRVHADRGEVVDRRAEPDRLRDRRGAGLEPVRRRRRRSSPPCGRSRSSSRRRGTAAAGRAAPARDQHADAGRAADLVPGEGDEVRAERGHVHRHVRHGLRGVEHDQRADLAGPRG